MKNLIREHPTMAMTLSYLIVTAIGGVYSFFFYREFGVNIIKFAELTDFLLVSVMEPISIVIFLSVVIFTLSAFMVDFWVRKKRPGYGRWLGRRIAPKYSDPIIYIVAVTLLVTLYVRQFAIENANEVKSGTIDEYTVRIADPGEQPAERTLALLGNTSRFSILFDYEESEVLIIPLENVSLMRKNSEHNDIDQTTEEQSL